MPEAAPVDAPPAAPAQPSPPGGLDDAALGDVSNLTLDAYADQLKRARQLAGLSQLLPKSLVGGATDSSVAATLKAQEDVIRCARTSCQYLSTSAPCTHSASCRHRAMTPDERAVPTAQLSLASRQRIACTVGVTVEQVGEALAKFEWTRDAMGRMAQLRAEGKPMPKSFDDLEVR